MVGERAGGAGRFPVVSLAGGEGNGVEEQGRTELYPMVVFLGLGVAGLGVPHGEVRRRLWQLAGDCAAAADWGCGGAWKLREARADHKAGSERAEEGCSGRFMAVSSLPAFGQSACVLGCWRQGTGE